MGKGTRFNAEKQQAGKYYSTPIWSFTMKCPECPGQFVIHTDPQHAQYSAKVGIQWQEKEKKSEEDQDVQVVTLASGGQSTTLSAFAQLEKQEAGKATARVHNTSLATLFNQRNSRYNDDFMTSRSLRARHRQRREQIKAINRKKENEMQRYGMHLEPVAASDLEMSRKVVFQPTKPPAFLDRLEEVRKKRAKPSMQS